MLVPQPPVLGPTLWALLIGFGLGSSFPLGLAVIAWRTPDGTTSAAVSGLALGVGYLAAGIGPLLMGVLIDLTGGFRAAIALLLAAGAAGVAICASATAPRPDHSRTTQPFRSRRSRCGLLVTRGLRRAVRPAPNCGSQLACRAALRAMPWPVRGSTSTAPVTELRRNSSPCWPDRVRAETVPPSGRVTLVPAVT